MFRRRKKTTRKKKSKALGKAGRVERESQMNQRLKYGTIAVIALVVIVVIIGAIYNTLVLPKKPIATVNGQEILIGDFRERVRLHRHGLVNQYNQILSIAQQLAAFNPEIATQYQSYLQQIAYQLEPEIIGQVVIDEMVDEIIIVQEAKKLGIVVTDEEVDERIMEIFGYYPDYLPTQTATPTTAPTSTLSETQMALITLTPTPTEIPTETPEGTPAATEEGGEEIEGTPAATDEGEEGEPEEEAEVIETEEVTLTPETVEESDVISTPTATDEPLHTPTETIEVPPSPTPTEYTFEAYQQVYTDYLDQVKSEAKVSEGHIREYVRNLLYREKLMAFITTELPREREMAWVRHILVADQETAKSVLERLAEGEDWTDLAAELSTDGSAKTGGDLGWVTFSGLVEEFATAAFDLGIGEISEPVETIYGWHIIQSIGKEDRPLSPQEYESYKIEKLGEWLEEIRPTATIDKVENWVRYTPTKPGVPTISQSQQPIIP